MYFCSRLKKHRGVEQLVARQAHNLEVARSNPASATQEARHYVSGFVVVLFFLVHEGQVSHLFHHDVSK